MMIKTTKTTKSGANIKNGAKVSVLLMMEYSTLPFVAVFTKEKQYNVNYFI